MALLGFFYPFPVKVVFILCLHIYKHSVEDLYQTREVHFSLKELILSSLYKVTLGFPFSILPYKKNKNKNNLITFNTTNICEP